MMTLDSRGIWDMSAFWQCRHLKLQPGVEKRLFFYRVDVSCYDLVVDQRDKFAVRVLPDAADSPFSIPYLAVVRAEEAADLVLAQLLPEHRLVHV